MPTLTYPGVYIEEIPSGVHTITGVATSIAAFVGWTDQGPTDQATLVQSWSDFARQFGGLDSRSYLGYAVNQFFGNGGQQAYIVRLADTTAAAATVTITALGFDSTQTASPSSVAIAGSYPPWAANTKYPLGALVLDPHNNVQRCTTPGTSGTGPTWQTAPVGTAITHDGTPPTEITWTLVEPYPQWLTPHWVGSTNYAVGALVVDTNGNVQRCTTAGTSGTTAPTWQTTLGATTTPDGSATPPPTPVTWTLVALSSGGGGLTLTALNPGSWGNNYAVQIQPRADDYTRFTLSVLYTDPTTGTQSPAESFSSLSLNPSDTQSRYAVNIINEQSNYIAATMGSPALTITNTPSLPTTPIQSGTANIALGGGEDGSVLTPTTGTPKPFESALLPSGGTGGVNLLDTVPIFNLLCVPGETDPQTIQTLQAYCVGKRAFLIVDCQSSDTFSTLQNGPSSSITGTNAINSAFYFPWVNAFDPQLSMTRAFPPCGFVAGLYAATDASRNVWKAPAGIDASLTGESGLTQPLTDLQNGTLNIQAINCIRHFPVYGDIIWGARTLRGNNQVGSEWAYVPIRRFALFLESSLYDGTKWVVFEPNDEHLWSQIRLNVGAFMQGLFMQGAFQGNSPQQAYFVKCDAENNPQSSIDQGIVNILVGFAPLYPAEFVVIQIQQMAGQAQS